MVSVLERDIDAFRLSIMKNIPENEIPQWMDRMVERYNVPDFVENDPISVPASFTDPRDQEIAGFFTAVMAWGLRKTIIRKARELMDRMDRAPYDFITQSRDEDLKVLMDFKHRTFQPTDVLYFVEFLRYHYEHFDSLEDAFTLKWNDSDPDALEHGLVGFHDYMFSLDYAPHRTRKHVATPVRRSTCKRLNMMMRWFVRNDDKGVDLGIWKAIKPRHLYIPVDVHVDRIGRQLGIISRKQTDWKTVKEITEFCRNLDPEDPGKYDFALFGYGLEKKYGYF